MKKLHFTSGMWEIVTIAFLCLAIVSMSLRILGYGDESYTFLAVQSILTVTVVMPSARESETR